MVQLEIMLPKLFCKKQARLASLNLAVQESPVFGSLSSIGVLLFVYLVANWCLMKACQLPGYRYHEPVLLTAYLKSLPRHPICLAFGIVVACSLLLNFRRLRTCWAELEHGGALRVIVVVCAFALAWPFVTADFNLYLNQEHLLDRVAVIACLVLLCWRPVFVIPLLIAILPLIAQRNEPLGNYTWTTHLLPIRILLLSLFIFVMLQLPVKR